MAKATVYYFNPTCELAVANGSFSYMPPLLLQKMERDLSILPLIFASGNDFVLTENSPSSGFLCSLKEAGFDLPQFCSLADLEGAPAGSFENICPWGWSPAAHFKLKNLKQKCSGEFIESPVFDWKAEHQLLFERSTSLDFLKEFLNQNQQDWFIDKSLTGVKVSGCEEIESLLKRHSSIAVKAPISSSGRGIQVIRKSGISTSNRQWISGILKQQNYLIAEPFLEKLTDLSFQFQVLPNAEVNYLGYTVFETNSNGQYKGTFIHPELKNMLPSENNDELIVMITTTADLIRQELSESVYSKFHRGFLGVDAMIVKYQEGLKIHPCIEINSRMNMGILTTFLEKKVHPYSTGKFELFYGSKGEYSHFEKEQTKLNPPVFQEGKLKSGFLPLTEPDPEKKFGAYISLGFPR